MSLDLDILLRDVQRALLDAVVPSLRAVTLDVDEKNKQFFISFFYDEEVTDELFDLASVAGTETGVSLPEYFTNEEITRLDFPAEIPKRGWFVYFRKEPVLPHFEKRDLKPLIGRIIPIGIFMLEMQQALLGRVTPALRRVVIGIDTEKKILRFFFYYDGEISTENFELASSAIEEASALFSGFQVEKRIARVDYPSKIPPDGERLVYERKEIVPD